MYFILLFFVYITNYFYSSLGSRTLLLYMIHFHAPYWRKKIKISS